MTEQMQASKFWSRLWRLVPLGVGILSLWMVAMLPAPAAAAGAKAAASAKVNSKANREAKPGKAKASNSTAQRKRPVRKTRAAKSAVRTKARAPARPSVARLNGLHHAEDQLDLKSSVALVIDQETDEVLFSKNPDAVLPIASITKLMTALVVTEAHLSLDEVLTVTQADLVATGTRRSRLAPGTKLTRGELLHLSLMASENRAAHLLGRTYPGGMDAFVEAMNGKAQLLGMHDTRYVEPTGLSDHNRSSAQDLTRLVRAAFEHPIIRELSTSLDAVIPVGKQAVQFRNTNGLVHNPEWEIGLQKTGYIAAAGRCVVMQAELAGRKFIMVLLDSAGRYSRIGDAERLRQWLVGADLLPDAAQALPR